MYFVDDVCYAGTPSKEIRVAEAQPLVGGMMLVLFSSGEKRLFDATILDGPAFEPLQSEDVFATARVEHGFISWADGSIDVAPEYVYANSVPYDESDVLKASESSWAGQ